MTSKETKETGRVKRPQLPFLAMIITATIYTGFALWLGSIPNALLANFGIEESTPQMLTEIRAFYGGVELAIGILMILLWFRGDKVSALLVGALPLVGSASGRCLGMTIDGFSWLHTSLVPVEIAGAGFCLAGIFAIKRKSKLDPGNKVEE